MDGSCAATFAAIEKVDGFDEQRQPPALIGERAVGAHIQPGVCRHAELIPLAAEEVPRR